jgi:hypothetical protein
MGSTSTITQAATPYANAADRGSSQRPSPLPLRTRGPAGCQTPETPTTHSAGPRHPRGGSACTGAALQHPGARTLPGPIMSAARPLARQGEGCGVPRTHLQVRTTPPNCKHLGHCGPHSQERPRNAPLTNPCQSAWLPNTALRQTRQMKSYVQLWPLRRQGAPKPQKLYNRMARDQDHRRHQAPNTAPHRTAPTHAPHTSSLNTKLLNTASAPDSRALLQLRARTGWHQKSGASRVQGERQPADPFSADPQRPKRCRQVAAARCKSSRTHQSHSGGAALAFDPSPAPPLEPPCTAVRPSTLTQPGPLWQGPRPVLWQQWCCGTFGKCAPSAHCQTVM